MASYPVGSGGAASSSEEEEEGPPPLPPGAQSPAYHGGLSSGSEEDQDGEGSRRWRGRPGPGPGSALLDEDCKPDSCGLNLRSMDSVRGAGSLEPPTSPRAPVEEGPREWGTDSPPCAPGPPQEGLRSLSDTVGGAFRVAKVSFPAYLASPSGSCGSSRYSSTETLKDEDLWASRGSGSWGVYRSPSFGAGEGLLLRSQARTRTKGPVGTARALRDGGLELDKRRQRKSLSNPDIASETLTLLSFLRSDLSELRVRKSAGRPGDLGSSPLDGRDSPSARGMGGQLGPMAPAAPAAPGTRPTLKDLTATLRRTKSFTCSEKPVARRQPRTNALKPSSSELLLADPGAEEDPLPLIVQDQYVQEARQVFEKIQRMGAQQDDGSDIPPGSPEWAGDMAHGQRSQEELSGPESSLMDEGIGADPEPPVSAFCSLGTTGVWRPLNSPSAQTNQIPGTEDSVGGWSLVAPDTPPTPGALRRRRKVPPSGPGGTELSNGEAGEAYRSLSDPIPQRHRATTSEEPSGFSVDSNLLGSLSPKTGLPVAPAVDEGLTSGHSDWSVGSEESKGYQEVIQSIVQEPGALGRVVDDRVAGKAPKKKSLSDPSRRGELAGPGFEGPGGEPIREVEPTLPPSSSEPILADRQAEPGEPSPARGRAQSEMALPEPLSTCPSAHHDFHLDPKLADVLSPRLIRRGSKKRPARSSHQELPREEGHQARPSSKHVRHASVPATFTPIVVPEPPTSVGPPVAVPEPMGFPARAHPTLQAPSLEDVTKQYMLTLHSGEVPAPVPVPVDMPCLTPVVAPPSAEAKPPEATRTPEEPAPASKCCSKPQVESAKTRGPHSLTKSDLGVLPHLVGRMLQMVKTLAQFTIALEDMRDLGPAAASGEPAENSSADAEEPGEAQNRVLVLNPDTLQLEVAIGMDGGAAQATNRENIQKAISRLDEDLTTLGQMSKLSESLGFPHQVCSSA
ncbi:rho guanine nucleotide exchange factor 17-like [Myotis lucifugus]|uniref:rho guanine nucleotide exchange factor 17-like n=1 Tax=Myotis lucifugus TaxID=59463 RepID=UPI000CCC1DEA|nr:rho guanine nucleotide exchange factor 17-like [Myotis lucifugus]